MSGSEDSVHPFDRKFTRRETLWGATLVAAGLSLGPWLAACGTEDTSTGASPSAGGEPQAGGSLVFARRQGPVSLNPLNNIGGNGDIFATEIIFSPLVTADPKGAQELVPGLADTWEASSDGLTYTFHLRDGAKWADGEPVTVDDVKFSLDRFADPDVNTMLPNLAQGMEGTDVVDASHVAVRLSEPVSAFLYNISIFPAFIVPKKLVEAQGDKFFDMPIGSGPFMVKEWVRDSRITFVKNPYYWESGKPYLDEVRYDYATDDNSRMLALKTGDAQAADGVLWSDIESMKSNSSVAVQFAPVPYFQGLWLNHTRPYLADKNVRQALQYALDKESINSVVFASSGAIPNSILPAFRYDASAEEVPPYPYDVNKAKELIAASGFPDGFSTTLQYPAGFSYYRKLSLILQEAWKQIGADVKLVELNQDTEISRFFDMDYDMTFPFAQFTSDLFVPDEYAGFMLSEELKGFYSGWSNADIKQMFDEFTVADEATRATLWPQIQKAFLEETPVINVMNLPFVNAYATNVHDPFVNALGANRLEHTWMA